MRRETRQAFNAFVKQIASLNGIDTASEKFTVDPTVQQTLENKIQESSAFLSKINIIGVTEQSGERLGLGIGRPIASTTDTTVQDRKTTDPSDMDKQGYFCTQTNYDTHIRYDKLDAWAKFPDFQLRLRNLIIERCALDRIMIGLNGKSRAVTSDPVANPMLEDVNLGWLEKYRQHASARVMTEVASGSNAIKIGGAVTAANGYKNLDALVYDAVNALIEPWYQEDTGLVALLSRDLLADKYFPLVNTNHVPTETMAADMIISQKRVGGLPAVRVPYFPPGSILITRLDNLSIYYQTGARRRTIVDNAKRDQIENYESSNDAYVVEDYGMGCLLENIELED